MQPHGFAFFTHEDFTLQTGYMNMENPALPTGWASDFLCKHNHHQIGNAVIIELVPGRTEIFTTFSPLSPIILPISIL